MLNAADVFVVYDDMQYTKRDWRNRNLIKTPNGLSWLTIPVQVKGKYFQKISETRLSDQKWRVKHQGAIRHNYSKSNYFKEISALLDPLYEAEYETITEVNLAFIKAIFKFLGITTEIRYSSEFDLVEDRNERLLQICQALDADEYISGPSAQGYIDDQLFSDAGIAINWFDYSGYKEYDQLYDGFEHGVSILDLLFNAGPEAAKYLKTF